MTTTDNPNQSVAFDVSKYQINKEPETITVSIEETGESFELKTQQLSWSKRNQLISQFMSWTANGDTSFDADAYVRACLREMIVDAPWGKPTETFLISIDARLGTALEQLVPSAFSMEVNPDAVKKE